MSTLTRLEGGISALVVFTYVLAMALTIVLLTSTSIGQDLASNQGRLVLGAFFIPIYTPIQVNLLASFLGLFGIFVLCFVVAARYNGGFVLSLRHFINPAPQERKLPNWLAVMPLASSALLSFVLAITIIQGTVGVPTGSLPPLEPYQLFYTLAYAPPLEEAMFRISALGLLVTLRVIWSNPVARTTDQTGLGPRKHSLARIISLGFLAPESAKREAGLPTFTDAGWHAIHWTEWLILVGTSVGFGLAHVFSGAGWEAGKVLPAAVSGFALGISYLLYGAYANILLHWFFNVYFEAYTLSSTMLGGAFVVLEGLIGLLAFVAGGVGIVAGIVWLSSGQHHAGETTYMVPSASPPV